MYSFLWVNFSTEFISLIFVGIYFQYTNKSNCKRHMMIHTDDRKVYECDYCFKRFSQKYEVRMHSRIHTGMEKWLLNGIQFKTNKFGIRFDLVNKG